MDISAMIRAVLISDAERSGKSLAALMPGDTIIGKVIEVKGDGRAVVDLGRSRATAHINFPVEAGQHLQLQVVENASVLHLRASPAQSGTKITLPLPKADFSNVLASQDQDKWGQIVQRLTSESGARVLKNALPENIQNALTQIQSVFGKLHAEQTPEKIARLLKSAVEQRGILFEKRLADLTLEEKRAADHVRVGNPEFARPRIIISGDAKSQLILLKNYLAQTGEHNPLTDQLNPKEIDFLRSSVDRMLGHIEQQQERAVARWADGEMQQVFIHTLPLQGQNRPLQLKLYYPRKEGGEKRGQPHRIALLLDMERLGPLRVDLSMIEGHLKINFFVRDLKTRQLIAPQIHEVETSLIGYFDQIQIEVWVSEEKIRQFEEEDSKKTAAGRINLKI
jgi:hypothetical protein